MKSIKNICLVILGLAIGWLANDAYESDRQKLRNSSGQSMIDLRQTLEERRPKDASTKAASQVSPPIRTDIHGLNLPKEADLPAASRIYTQPFIEHLREERFSDAMNYYEEMESADEGKASNLKRAFLTEMQAWISQGRLRLAINAQLEFLAHYYNDVVVYKSLAKTYEIAGNVSDAIRAYFRIKLYAPDVASLDEIELALTKMITSTDKRLNGTKDWTALVALYQQLIDQNPQYPGYKFRLAQIFHSAGKDDNAISAIADIIDEPQWSVQARALLGEINTGDADSRAVDLKKRGMHYLVDATIDDTVTLTLLIDTGASLTVLTQQRFEEIYNEVDFEFLGQRLMNTANGIANSSIYRVHSLSIEDYTLNNIEIAILDYQTSSGIDGLLGMNVLRNYQFNIDQGKKLLHLAPR